MDNVVLFKPKVKATAENNLARYIHLARTEITLWAENGEFSWHSHYWKTAHRGIRFVNLKGRKLHKTKTPNTQELMSTDFGEFARAYIRYTQNLKPTQTFTRSIQALQLLEEAMMRLDGRAIISDAEERHFIAASSILLEEKIQDRTGVGNALESLCNHISQNRLTSRAIIWKHPFIGKLTNPNAPQNLTRDQNEAKLPCSDAIWAIAEVFSNGYSSSLDDEDVFITSCTALLLSSPFRIGELGYLRTKPYTEEKNSLGEFELILRGYCPKTNKFMSKGVVDSIAPVTKDALKRLKSITDAGRNLAAYLESGNNRFYRHDQCPQVDDDAPLTPEEVTAALGFRSHGSTETFLRQYTGNYAVTGFTLNSLWTIVKAHNKKLNPHFPYQIPPEKGSHRLKMSESLMCLRYNQLSNTLSTSPVFLVPYKSDYYAKRVTNKHLKRGDKSVTMSFFHKHNYNGVSVNSHQFRHLLNTVAQQAGVSIQVITEWSERASQQQTITYMHESNEDKARKIAENRIPAIELINTPITPDEYRSARPKGPSIITPYEFCTHDYTVSHCNKFKDCLNCSELILCKGHKRSIEEIEFERDSIKENLDAAMAEMKAGNRAADRWYETHRMRYEGYLALLDTMTDPSIPDGTPIKNVGLDFSLEQKVVEVVSTMPNDPPSYKLESNLSAEVLDYMKFMMDDNNASTDS